MGIAEVLVATLVFSCTRVLVKMEITFAQSFYLISVGLWAAYREMSRVVSAKQIIFQNFGP